MKTNTEYLMLLRLKNTKQHKHINNEEAQYKRENKSFV